jgi:WD40 repeat protein
MLILDGHQSSVHALAFSPDSYQLASGSRDGSIRIWDPAGGCTEGAPEEDGCNDICFRPDGSLVVGSRQLRATSIGEELTFGRAPFPRGASAVFTGVAVLDPGNLVVGTGDRAKPMPGSLEIFDARLTPRKPAYPEPHGVRAVAAHPPTRAFAWTNGSRRATVRTLDRQDPTHFNLTHNGPAVAFHPDGTMIAVAQEWGAKVFDLPRRQERTAIKGHKGQVSSVAFSPDGRYLVTGSWDGTVRLWDPLTGAERQSFQWPTGKVYAVAYAPDVTRLAAAGSSGAVVVWDAE